MSRHQKELTKKQKIVIYVSAAAAAVVAAIAAVVAIVHIVNNPPAIIFNSNSASYTSNFSAFKGSSGIIVPSAAITITPEGKDEQVAEIVKVVETVKPTNKNKVIVKTTPIDTSGLTKRQVKLSVKYLSQNPELPTGCEITALTTVLNHYGYDISKTKMSDDYLDKTIDKIGNFWEVYVGNPRKNGFGCYAKPIVSAANRYLATQNRRHKAVDYSGAKFEELLKKVEDGTPVIIWSTMYDEAEKQLREPFTTVKWTVDNKDIQWIAPEHCMVLIGYDIDRNVAIMSDPQRGIVEYNLETVYARYIALHMQCVVLEEIPVINGIENGAIYYTTQYVTIADYNLESVTINGEESETAFLIKGNEVNMYVIEATDFDGNTVTYTIYTKPVSALLEPIGKLNSDTVTLDDLDAVNQVKNTALKTDTRYSSPEETEALDKVVTTCNTLLTKIESINNDISRVTKKIQEYEEQSLESDNSTDLHLILNDIDSILSTNNLTETQRTSLNEQRTKCENWLSSISKPEPDVPPAE